MEDEIPTPVPKEMKRKKSSIKGDKLPKSEVIEEKLIQEDHERSPTALEKIEEILNPSLKIPETIGPYRVPDEVKAGDVEALKDLDERKIIELKEVFTLFDTDADGFLSEADLRATFIALGKEASSTTIEQMLNEAMSPLDFDAFVVLMGYKTIELDPEDVLLEAWSKWDKNGTGYISEEKCIDQIHIFPHLREPVIPDTIIPEETICLENAYNLLPSNTTTLQKSIQKSLQVNNFNIDTNQVENFKDNTESFASISRKYFHIENRQSIFSSDKILGIRLIYDPMPNLNAFNIIGKFHFIDKLLFKNDGNLVPTTYCDYQFLPRSINYANDYKIENTLWRYFHSPRFPAKYPDHIKCAYKFIGRPRNHVEVIFEEIYLLTGHSSCLHHSDKITVYDSKTPDKSSVIDVFCNEKLNSRIVSSGPNLLIEFEASSNRTSNGFSAKYRFIDIFQTVQNTGRITSENLTTKIIVSSTAATVSENLLLNINDTDIPSDSVEDSSEVTTTTPTKFDDIQETVDIHDRNNNVNNFHEETSQQGVLLNRSTITNITTNIGNSSTSSMKISRTGVRLCPPGIY